MICQYLVVTFGFPTIAVDNVGWFFRSRELKVHRLTGEGTKARADERKPKQQFPAIFWRAVKAPGFLGEIQ